MAELLTEFASPHRAKRAKVLAQSRHFSERLLFRQLLDHVPDMIMILNSDRQIVYANRTVLESARVAESDAIAGLRPGELFHCKHSTEQAAGCGTTRFCRCCGAAKAILDSRLGRFSVEECRMTIAGEQGEEALDLRVWASPMQIGGEQFTFFVVANIADEKRRLWLEKIFLHDLMNSATALRGFSWLLESGGANDEDHQCVHNIATLTERIIGEIESHRQLVAAENNELHVQLGTIRSCQVLEDVFAIYNSANVLNGRLLRIDSAADDVVMSTDRVLLQRVVGNMVKNALEGSVPGETVTLGCRREPDTVVFWVHNPTYIPENVRLQIFNRSFSTKGTGRGLGTYSMKLLTERYLRGSVSFRSTESGGTTFTAKYPVC